MSRAKRTIAGCLPGIGCSSWRSEHGDRGARRRCREPPFSERRFRARSAAMLPFGFRISRLIAESRRVGCIIFASLRISDCENVSCTEGTIAVCLSSDTRRDRIKRVWFVCVLQFRRLDCDIDKLRCAILYLTSIGTIFSLFSYWSATRA